MKMDIYHKLKGVTALAPQSITSNTTTDGPAIDLRGFNSCMFVLALGALNDIDGTVVIEESTTGAFAGEENAVADKFLLPNLAGAGGAEAEMTFDQTDANKVARIGYIGHKRYVRFTLVSTSTVGANLVSATAILGHPERGPVAAQNFA